MAAETPVKVMGILNVTPDSFSDGGRWTSASAAVARARAMITEGADIIDVGGESTRPGASPLEPAEELSRVLPVIEVIAGECTVSIDTRNAEVAAAAVRAGASIINDVSASLWETAARTGAGWMAMHMQGTPETMQDRPMYGSVLEEVRDYLFDRVEQAKRAGVSQIWIDPGIGFGKTVAHNLTLLRHLAEIRHPQAGTMVGISRKSFLGAIADAPAFEDRLPAALAVTGLVVACGVNVIRTHDVSQTVRAVAASRAVVGAV